MAIDYIRNIISSGYNLAKINDNFVKIEDALQDGLSRSGNGPNQMSADLDMNSNDLLNVKNIDADQFTLSGVVLVPGAELSQLPSSVMLSTTYDVFDIKQNVYDRKWQGDYNTEVELVSSLVASFINVVNVFGISSINDGGAHKKVRISTPSPIEPWHKQSADGSWWQIKEEQSKPEYFGAVGDGVANDTTAVQNADRYATQFSKPLLFSNKYLVTVGPSSLTNDPTGAGSFVYSSRTLPAAPRRIDKNHLWAGNFIVSQEAGSFTTTTYRRMMLDGMTGARVGFATGVTIFHDTGTYYSNACRIQRNATNSDTSSFVGVWNLSQSETYAIRGENAFLSLYSRAGENYSSGAVNIKVIGQRTSQQPIVRDDGLYDLGSEVLASYSWTPTTTMEPWLLPHITPVQIPDGITQVAVVLTVPYTGTAGTDDSLTIESLHLGTGKFFPAPDIDINDVMETALTRYRASYDYGVTPGTVTLIGSEAEIANSTTTLNGVVLNVKWETPMVTRPTVFPYSPIIGGNPRMGDETGNTRIFAMVYDVSRTGFFITNNAASVANNRYRSHWVARAAL